MATSNTAAIVSNITSDAIFRTTGSAISVAIQAVGLTQTADTGQINWTSVTVPLIASTIAGYEIYRFNDSLQSTAPVYFRIDYGTSSANSSWLGLRVTVGTSTNGAGTITGQVSTTCYLYMYSAGTARVTYVSGANNRLSILHNNASGDNNALIFSLERSHNSSGTDTGVGVYINGCSYYGGPFSQYLPLGTGVTIPPAQAQIYNSVPLTGSGVLGSDTYTWPVRVWTPQESLPSLNLIWYISTDITPAVPVSITMYDGTARTYLGMHYAINGMIPTGCNGSSLLMIRYD